MTIGLILISCKFVTFEFHYDISSNRRQLNDNDLRSKIFVGNYEPIMGICEKILITSLHNLQILFML